MSVSSLLILSSSLLPVLISTLMSCCRNCDTCNHSMFVFNTGVYAHQPKPVFGNQLVALYHSSLACCIDTSSDLSDLSALCLSSFISLLSI